MEREGGLEWGALWKEHLNYFIFVRDCLPSRCWLLVLVLRRLHAALLHRYTWTVPQQSQSRRGNASSYENDIHYPHRQCWHGGIIINSSKQQSELLISSWLFRLIFSLLAVRFLGLCLQLYVVATPAVFWQNLNPNPPFYENLPYITGNYYRGQTQYSLKSIISKIWKLYQSTGPPICLKCRLLVWRSHLSDWETLWISQCWIEPDAENYRMETRTRTMVIFGSSFLDVLCIFELGFLYTKTLISAVPLLLRSRAMWRTSSGSSEDHPPAGLRLQH